MNDSKAMIEQDEFRQMDILDEEAIVAELSEETQSTWIYQFTNKDGKRVTGLSWVGVKEVGYRMDALVSKEDKFQLDHVHTEFTADVVICIVRACFQGRSRLGAAEAQRTMEMKTGQKRYDPFAVPKALNKAQRNAMSALFSSEIVDEVKRVALMSPEQRVKVLKPETKQIAAQPQRTIESGSSNGNPLTVEQRAALDDIFTYGAQLLLARETIIDVLKAGGFEARRDLPAKRDAMLAALDAYAAKSAQLTAQESAA